MKPLFRIKICGVTRVEDAITAANAGADAIGLNFYTGSPRCVSAGLALEIRRALPEGVWCVGVFVNAGADEVTNLVSSLRLDAIQLHGDEPPEYLAEVGPAKNSGAQLPIIRAFRCRKNDYAQMNDWLERSPSPVKAALIDAFVEDKYGGGGEVVDWRAFVAARPQFSVPLILAGGLTAENVASAIATARPDAVDVASGVESSPGIKDPELVCRFVKNAKRAFCETTEGSG